MQEEHITHNGVRMTADWPAKIEAAQRIAVVRISGLDRPRVAHGSEEEDWGAPRGACHDCAVLRGQFHVSGCDAERCPDCRGQLISCDCEIED